MRSCTSWSSTPARPPRATRGRGSPATGWRPASAARSRGRAGATTGVSSPTSCPSRPSTTSVGDGNDFAFNRKGEWLTKNRSQYETGFTDYTNALTIGNDRPEHDEPGDARHTIFVRGGQYTADPAADPKVVARSFGDAFVAITGVSTGLYNSVYEGVSGVRHASRSIVWLEPDQIVVYDRVAVTRAHRFKRFWLQLPGPARISGNRAAVRTPRGQQLFSTTLLPLGARLTSSRDEGDVGQPAVGEPMTHRLRVEAPPGPRGTRFLHVIQGADAGASPDAAALLRSSGGTPYEGVRVKGTAVLFAVNLARVDRVAVTVGDVRRVLVTGLVPGGRYAARLSGGRLTVRPGNGAGAKADEGGVLDLKR